MNCFEFTKFAKDFSTAATYFVLYNTLAGSYVHQHIDVVILLPATGGGLGAVFFTATGGGCRIPAIVRNSKRYTTHRYMYNTLYITGHYMAMCKEYMWH